MGLSYKKSSVPTTLRGGEFAVVDGVTYVGNSDDEPILAKGYKEFLADISISENPSISNAIINEIGGTPTISNTNGLFQIVFNGVTSNSNVQGYAIIPNLFEEGGTGIKFILANIYDLDRDNDDNIRIRFKTYNTSFSQVSPTIGAIRKISVRYIPQ